MGKILIIKGADFSAVAVSKVEPIIGKVVITVVANPAGGGTVTGGGSYEEGMSIEISATAASGYRFVQWSDGNTNATRTITVGSSSKTYTATFEDVSTHKLTESEANYVAEAGYMTTVVDQTVGSRNVKLISQKSRSRCEIDMSALKSAGYKTLQFNNIVAGNAGIAAVGCNTQLTTTEQLAYGLDESGQASGSGFGYRDSYDINITTYAYKYLYLQLSSATTSAYDTDWNIVAKA